MIKFYLSAAIICSIMAIEVASAGSGVLVSAKVYSGICCSTPLPQDSIAEQDGNALSLMGLLCQQRGSERVLNLGVPANGAYIGRCSVSTIDGNVYACDSDNDPLTQDGWCASWGEYDCSTASSHACALATDDDNGCSKNNEGNPCNASTGNKSYSETLLKSGTLTLKLTYNSQDYSYRSAFGFRWTSNFDKEIYFDGSSTVAIIDTQGKGEIWKKNSTTSTWESDNDTDISLTETQAGFIVEKNDGSKDYYEFTSTSDGRLVSKEVDRHGNIVAYSYDSAYSGGYRNLEVTDEYGGYIKISRINKFVEDAHGNRYSLTIGNDSILRAIIYPDTTPLTQADNQRRQFHYENANYPKNLTGITDENGDRYATYAYDVVGKAISTEHSQTTNAAGQERFELDYQGEN